MRQSDQAKASHVQDIETAEAKSMTGLSSISADGRGNKKISGRISFSVDEAASIIGSLAGEPKSQDTPKGKIQIAARWYADHGHKRRPVVPTLRRKFNLSNSEAIEALTVARTMERNSSEQEDKSTR